MGLGIFSNNDHREEEGGNAFSFTIGFKNKKDADGFLDFLAGPPDDWDGTFESARKHGEAERAKKRSKQQKKWWQ